MNAHLNPNVRHDFVLVFDVSNGNPNGDPDNGNAPRIDPETGHLWVTDGAIKRKVRNFVAETKGATPGFGIYVSEGVALNSRHREAYEKLKIDPKKKTKDDVMSAQQQVCTDWWDVRTFGAVLSTGEHAAGQVRGPVQLTTAVSVEPVLSNEMTITRVAVTDEKELENLYKADVKGGKDREMGSKHLVPYALFQCRGFFVPSMADRTGFSADDLAVFWDALERMWFLDRSSSRGVTGCRGVHIFSHEDALGRCHPDKLFGRVTATRTSEQVARSFSDYRMDAAVSDLPPGVTYTCLAS